MLSSITGGNTGRGLLDDNILSLFPKGFSRVMLFICNFSLKVLTLDEGSTNFLGKRPDSKYIRLYGLCGLCHNYSSLQL